MTYDDWKLQDPYSDPKACAEADSIREIESAVSDLVESKEMRNLTALVDDSPLEWDVKKELLSKIIFHLELD